MFRTFPLSALLLLVCLVAISPPARADMGLTATSEQTTYARGQTNRFVFDLNLISQAYEGGDNVYFDAPAGVTISGVHYLDGFHSCPDALLLVLGMGTGEGGWYNPGYPSFCGYFGGAPDPGEPQTMAVDIDVPAAYVGDLPIVITVQGDGCCDPPPHEGTVTLTFSDGGAPLRWDFDDTVAPALPVGWTSAVAAAGSGWTTQSGAGDTAPNAAYAQASASAGESILTSPAIVLPAAGGELHFTQRFAIEAGHDGGVLEIAVDGGAFDDILSAGGTFGAGAYDGGVDANAGCSGSDANPLSGRSAWSGTQDAFAPVTVGLPAAAAGHSAQFRWRLGTDCSGAAGASNGWWIDGVSVTSTAPQAAIGPARLAVSTDTDAQRVETLGIGNSGGGVLTYAIAIAEGGAADCSTPANPAWLHLGASSGSVAGGVRDEVAIELDSSGLADGPVSALLCVTTSDPSTPSLQIPVALDVTAGSCQAVDRLFANGFDDASNGACGTALQTFDDRDAFLARVANDYDEDRYTGLRSGYLYGPIDFGNATYTYSVFTQDGAAGGLYLFAGSGMLSSAAAQDQLVITFTGAPVTAIGGNFWGQLFFSSTSVDMNTTPPTTVVLTLDDGSSETFSANGPDDFRGFVATAPIRSLTLGTPEPDPDGDFVWGVVDNLIVGRAR
ncbi:MAG TPA: hypothetical protein VGC55_06320 [Dokdonella sp.]